ncbi:MAG: PEP-CTERM sorting domain-containing protein [Pseudomonadota bacterium]
MNRQKKTVKGFTLIVVLAVFWVSASYASSLIIDHNNTDITMLTEAQINQAKSTLHIAYGHTSHGSQVTDGMSGLVGFANNGGKGLSLPDNIFAWNNGGAGGALDLHDYAMGGDVGYYPDWYDNTRTYLDNAANDDVNVIIWSWCGQVSSKYANGTLVQEYLAPMQQLESDYSDVSFVYMTGHVDHWDDANNKAANQMIRDFCLANDKILYDFADIESYDPDGIFYEFPHDNANYYASATGSLLGNWAIEWQNSHTEGEDWYSCSSAHSEPLNANQKAYAAWHLWSGIEERMDTVPVPGSLLLFGPGFMGLMMLRKRFRK